MNRLARRFLYIFLAMLTTLVTGTVGFTLIDNYPPFDAFYMTLITMTTVGYSEIHPLSQRRPHLQFLPHHFRRHHHSSSPSAP